MKSIKSFKYFSEKCFKVFLKDYGYKIENVKGFAFDHQSQYHGNVLKVYAIHFNDGETVSFSSILFKSFNEYHQSRLGFNGNKLFY